jgi:hypothetical protein
MSDTDALAMPFDDIARLLGEQHVTPAALVALRDNLIAWRDAHVAAAKSEWQPIETAPRDGSKIDLMFREPRGRQLDCFWYEGSIKPDGGWFWRTPTWGDGGELLPEVEWHLNCYPNNEPTHWMLRPAPPVSA